MAPASLLSSYEALNVYCPEYDLPVATEFRDGNVNPGYGQLEQLQGVLAHLPEGVRKVKYRSDSAGYQTQLLRYLAEGQDARFGVRRVCECRVRCAGSFGKRWRRYTRRIGVH